MEDIQRLLNSAGIDPEAAPKLLAIAATYLRRGEPLPPNLATYFAVAFEKAANQPRGEQVNALKDGLGLGVVPGAPRVGVDEQEIHEFVAGEIVKCPNFSETQLKKKVASKFEISETKALDFVKPTAFVPKLMRSNAISSLIRKRN